MKPLMLISLMFVFGSVLGQKADTVILNGKDTIVVGRLYYDSLPVHFFDPMPNYGMPMVDTNAIYQMVKRRLEQEYFIFKRGTPIPIEINSMPYYFSNTTDTIPSYKYGQMPFFTEHSHIPYDTLHYYSVVLQPHNGKKTYQTIVKDVYYIPDLKLWLNSKRKPLLRGQYQNAEVFKIEKIK